ncbi:LEF-8 [Betabaculovirus altermyunipunctae]|uniref:LEF-8 n=2 Tax=Betabaculovirus TaxID=558017 RepID=A0A1S5YE18_9BBAC|nr:LEF-8 [Betabaculovirus altermyunipunctae]AQQ80399.1 LEF-8 [Betabaculovirus altermyunipunctae]
MDCNKCVTEDFDALYQYITDEGLALCLSCTNPDWTSVTLKKLQDRRTYLCCAVNVNLTKCVLHNCVVVIIGTRLDARFRNDEPCRGFEGTYIIDGRHFSFPNIMMNNNILLHNFFDKQYPRDKNMRRMFLYGNYDEEKSVNRAIQLVYDRHDDVMYVRDVYAKDYIVDSGINQVLIDYLKSSGKWADMDFVFNFNTSDDHLFAALKSIMSVDIDYTIDSLSNKIIYKHAYLLKLTYDYVLVRYKTLMAAAAASDVSLKKKKPNFAVMFVNECKKIHDIIVSGKLIQSVSKTLSKQKKYDHDYNSNNNNLEVYPLKFRIGCEVLRVVNENLQQDMLKHTKDYVKYVDSFFHGEMTVAGKKFFLCKDVVLPNLRYKAVGDKFRALIQKKLFVENTNEAAIMVAFNNRPTVLSCQRKDFILIYYELKRAYSPVELKFAKDILFVNHHEGMIMLKRRVKLNGDIYLNTFQTPYEYHNRNSIVNTFDQLSFEDDDDDVSCLMSTMIHHYYQDHLYIFPSVPGAKLIVSLTNLKNGMMVNSPMKLKEVEWLPLGHSAAVDESIRCNDRMFQLWTIVRDNRLKTAEDPYIPHVSLPIRVYNNKVHKLRGKLEVPDASFVYRKSCGPHNVMDTEGGHRVCIFGTLVCQCKINWSHDNKKFKIEYFAGKTNHIYKIYMYFRRVTGLEIELLDSELNQGKNDEFNLKIVLITSVSDLEGLKICGIHGQKGVLNEAEDLSKWRSSDGVHAQICLSPISFLSRQSNFDHIPKKMCRVDGREYPMYLIPYMFFNNTPDNIYKEFIGRSVTGYEKLEGTRLDQWSINQSFMGNRLPEGLHCVRNGNNTLHDSGQYNIFKSLLYCNNISIID